MEHKALGYLSLARKARRIEAGEAPVLEAIRTGSAQLVLVAEDAGDHTWRRVSAAECALRVSFTKAQLGQAVGRQCVALLAFTDASLALAFLKALGQENTPLVAALSQKADRKNGKTQNLRRKKCGV